MRGYVNLPAFRAPGPLNFQPLNQGIDAVGQKLEKNRLLQQQQDIGTALSEGGYGEAADKAFAGGDLKTGLSLTQAEEGQEDRDFNRNRLLAQDRRAAASDARSREIHGLNVQKTKGDLRDRLVKNVAGVAQMIRNEQDPARKQQMLQAFTSANPQIEKELGNIGFDPANPDAALDMIIAEASGIQKPTDKAQYQFTKYGVGNKYTGELQPYPQGAAASDPKLEQNLRKEFTALSKDYRAVEEGADRVRVGSELNNGVGDLSLIFGYMKLLDPGSVVREGEFANAENAQGVPDRIRNTWNRIMSGERLNPTTRQEFVAAANALAEQQLGRHKRMIDQFTGIAIAAGADPSRVIVDFSPAEAGDGGGSGAPPPAPGQVVDGYRFRGGDPADQNSWEKVQ